MVVSANSSGFAGMYPREPLERNISTKERRPMWTAIFLAVPDAQLKRCHHERK